MPPRDGSRDGKVLVCTLAGAIALVAAACGTSSSPERSTEAPRPIGATVPAATSPATQPEPATTETPTTAARWTPEQQEVIDAYLRALDAEHKASAVSDPAYPEFVATHVDPMYSKLRDLYRARKLKGQATKYPEPSVFSVEPKSAELVDESTAIVVTCSIDDGIVYEPATGRVIDDKVSSALLRATLIKDNGVWKVSKRAITWNQPGASGCEKAS